MTKTLPIARRLNLGCTVYTHKRLGIHAVINARGGQQWRNDQDRIEEIEMRRDARALRERIENRVSVYQFGSRCFRRRLELARFLSGRNED